MLSNGETSAPALHQRKKGIHDPGETHHRVFRSGMGSPHKVDQIEMVQRCTARFVCNNHSHHNNVTAMLNKLQWDSLAQWRARAQVTMMYRISNNLV